MIHDLYLAYIPNVQYIPNIHNVLNVLNVLNVQNIPNILYIHNIQLLGYAKLIRLTSESFITLQALQATGIVSRSNLM